MVTVGDKIFLNWFDRHIQVCPLCKANGLMSGCKEMLANRKAVSKA